MSGGVCTNPGRLVMYAWSMCKSRPSGDICPEEYAPTSRQHKTKSKCNQICELDTSHLEAFFQAASGHESDGEREKLKNDRQSTDGERAMVCLLQAVRVPDPSREFVCFYCCLIQAVPLPVELVRHSVCLYKCACFFSQLLM